MERNISDLKAFDSVQDKLQIIISKLLFELQCLCGFLAYVCLSEKKLFNGCKYQKMLVYKVVTFLKRIKIAVLFFIFLDQIRPKWIKLATSVNRHLEFYNSSPKGLKASV